MVEKFTHASAEKEYYVDAGVIAEMQFQSELFRDPIGRIKALRDQLCSGEVTDEHVDMVVAQTFPIMLEALAKNVYNLPEEGIPASFRLLLDNPNEEDLAVTRATATIFRDVGIKQSTIRRWLIGGFNAESDPLGSPVVDEQLFQQRLAVIDDVYGNN